MGAGKGCSPMVVVLEAGQVRRALVEAGSVLVVAEGALMLRFPFAWLAEKMVARELPLHAEETYALAADGWVDLVAVGSAVAVILPPERGGVWARVGQALALIPSFRRAVAGSNEVPTGGTRRAGCHRLAPE